MVLQPFLFDRIFSVLGFFYFFIFIFSCYFIFCWLQLFLLDKLSLTRNASVFINILLISVVYNIFFSGRFWVQRLLGFDFFFTQRVKINKNPHASFDKLDLIFNQQTAYG